MSCSIISWALGQVAVVAGVWIAIALWLRELNFLPSGDRKDPPRDASDDIRAKQIEYHNNACYRIFEFFVKIALAVLGGAAYLATQAPHLTPHTKTLMSSAGWLLMLSALVLSGGMTIHQKSKIERWPRRYRWYQPLAWLELWFIQGMLLVAAGFLIWVIPSLA